MTSLLADEKHIDGQKRDQIDGGMHEYGDTLPNAMQAEYSILGAMLIQNDLVRDLSFLRPEHFFIPAHARIYAAMAEMYGQQETITPFTLGPRVAFEGSMVGYLIRAVASVSTAINSPHSDARVVIEMANRREVIRICQEQIETIKHAKQGVNEVIGGMNAQFERIITQGNLSKFQSDKQVSTSIIERLNNPRLPFSTGLAKLDLAMEGGLFPGMNYVFAARKKMGKTTLASTVSSNLNEAKVPHLFIAAEMSALEIQQRILARRTKTYTSSFRNDYGRTEQFHAKIREEIARSNGCIIFQSAPGITFEELRSSISQAISVHRIKGFILDSLQLVGGRPNKKSVVEHQDEVAQWCADYGRQREIFSIVTAQINQTGNIRGGEGVRLACDQAYEIHAPEDDPSRGQRWLEMIETRYTLWMNIGSKEQPGLYMHEFGQYLYEPDFSGDGTKNMDF